MIIFIRNYLRLIAIIFTAFAIFTNSASYALANPAVNGNESTDAQSVEPSIFALDKSSLVINSEDAALIPYYLAEGKKQGPEWSKTTSVNFSSTQDHKPIFFLETIQPFSQATRQGQLWFWQGRYARRSDTETTGNMGFGWRKLSEDKSRILGVNVFYDYGFQYNLSRIGVGTEYFNKLMEYRANIYLPVSGERLIAGSSAYIRAVRGMDYEIGSSFERAPWLSLHVMGFYYDNRYTDQYKGYRVRANMQLTPRVNLETGYLKASRQSGDLYVQLAYNQKVERENDIRTETRSVTSSPTIQIGSAIITVYINDGLNGTHLAGSSSSYPSQIVSVTVNGSTQMVTTDASGQATFSNLPAGSYTFTAGSVSAPVTVNAGAVATGTITMIW